MRGDVPRGKLATLYEPLPNGSVRCSACAQRCVIAQGRRGICAVRENREGKLYLLVYGKAVGMHADPIEKKPLHHFLPGSRSMSFGTVGCDFRCAFCQNADLSQASKRDAYFGDDMTPEEIVSLALEQDCASIAYTYNEPAIFAEYAHATARVAKRRGLRNVYVSNGYETEEAFRYIEPYLDAINIDLKSFSDAFYRKVCGARLQPVLETIERVATSKVWLELTTLVIPGENDSEEELRAIAAFIASVRTDIPWHVTRFVPLHEMQDRPETPVATLERAYAIGKAQGLRYVYVGNVASGHTNTLCPRCGAKAVERQGYRATITLKNGACARCGEKLPGVWT